jgi:hypothetical protein
MLALEGGEAMPARTAPTAETIAAIQKLDLRRDWKALYTARRKPAMIELPPRKLLCVEGKGAPEGIGVAFGALFPVAYTLKFLVRAELGIDYPVLSPEGAFSGPGGAPLSEQTAAETVEWAAMVAVPDMIDARLLRRAIARTMEKQPDASLERVRLRRERGATAAQVMHIGPWDAEEPTIAALTAFIAAEGYRTAGTHREVYLTDPERAPMERARTIIRYPVKPLGRRSR